MQTILDLGVDKARRSIVIACAVHSLAALRIPNEQHAIRTWRTESHPEPGELLAKLAHPAGLPIRSTPR